MKKYILGLYLSCFVFSAQSTLITIDNCTGAISCDITNTPPILVEQNPNNGILLAWDEVQNYTLTQDLVVDRVFDSTASFVEALPNGDFLIKAGTIIASHYLQWDPSPASSNRVEATIRLDSQVFAFITADQNLFDSDFLGLASVDYNDFGLRGLEGGDTTTFNGPDVDISWFASSPGDWTRLITAYSPAASVPEPNTFILLSLAVFLLASTRQKLYKKS